MTLEEQLARETTGEVLFDRFNRGRYATDASFYQIMPAGVVVPRTMDEALRALAIAREAGRIVTPRGGRDRGQIPKGAAPGRRLQSRCAGAAQRAQQHGASACRVRGYPRFHHASRTKAVAGDSKQGARRLPFWQFLRGDGCRAASG